MDSSAPLVPRAGIAGASRGLRIVTPGTVTRTFSRTARHAGELHLVPMLLGLLVLTACADAAGSGSGSSDLPPVSSTTVPGPEQQSPPAALQPNRLSPETALDLRRQRWTRVVPDAEGRRLEVQATFTGGPPCTVLGRVDVAENADAVTITLWVGRRPNAECGPAQAQLAMPIVTTVELKERLGSRAVHDGAA